MRRQHAFYERPRILWNKKRIEEEANILSEYGLRRKHEIWRAEAILRNFRRQARELIGTTSETVKKDVLLGKLNRLGILPQSASLDDILSLNIKNILERRLQTLVFRKGLAKTMKQARQFIVHGHITLNGRVVKSPSMLVPLELEHKIGYKKKTEESLLKALGKAKAPTASAEEKAGEVNG